MPHTNIVPAWGPTPNRVLVVGERPGESEYFGGRPFIGKAGKAQREHFRRNGVDVDKLRLDNICPDYQEGNPAPTPEEIEQWRPRLLQEIRRTRPKFIVTAGHHATVALLGSGAYLEAIHGIPQPWDDGTGLAATVIPTYHPAAPFHQPDLLQFVTWDYKRASDIIGGKLQVEYPVDDHPHPHYFVDKGNPLVGGGESGDPWAIDSEGTPGDVFSFQATVTPGSGHVFLDRVPRFRPGSLIIFHNGMYEIEMAASLGVDLLDPALGLRFFDTMMAAYLLCIEPQSLKNLARRHCGMVMNDYQDVVGDVGLKKQLDYLQRVAELRWPKPEQRLEWENDGTAHLYTPQPVERRAEAIIIDYYSEKLDKEGRRTDPLKRWRKVDRALRLMVEHRLGKMPVGTLRDVPLASAVYYGGRDPDATLRLYPRLRAALEAEGLTDLMALKMRMLPVAARMSMAGLQGRRASFENLSSTMWDEMLAIQGKLSREFFNRRPFNPNSSDQVATLMRKRGLKGEKRTKTGKVSTSKKSIEHLRHEDRAIGLVEDWRERMKVKTSFADPVLENWPEDQETVRVRGDLKITRVTSGRFSMSLLDDVPSAPLLAIPVRSSLGKAVRDCYEAESGYDYFESDLDQAEMRIMADESGDPDLVRLFVEGKLDVHTDTASKMFGIPYDRVDKMKHRYPAKRVGFGVITGIQGPGLLDQLRMAGIMTYDVDDCDRFIKEWLKIYPRVKDYMSWCAEETRRRGGVIKDRWGMPRYLPAIFSDDKWERLEAQRQSHSHRIQGGAQGWLQHVMAALNVDLAPEVKTDKARFILQIHDSLLFEAHSDEATKSKVQERVISRMCNVAKLKVPMKASSAWASSWGALKD